MKKELLHSLGPVIVLLLLASAFWILHHELRHYQYSDIKQALAEIPRNRLLLSFGLTILSYVALTGYDVLALRYVRHLLAYGRIALASCISYALSHNIGSSLFAGSAIRYRIYAARGLSTVQIAKVVAFCTLTFWLGILAIGGIVFLLEPMVIPASLHLPLTWLQPVGIICLVLVGAYVSWGVLRKTPITVREWEFSVPSVPLSPDLMRYLPEAPHGIMEYLFTELMLWGKRELRYTIGRPGFRTRQITLVTTLLDAESSRVADLAEWSRQRWQVETALA
jgi:uncharacterized membrane protein YbhN (UPF0104 family)